MAYIIPILLLVLGFSLPKSKVVTVLFLAYFWVLMGLNTYTPDYETYESMYDNILLYTNYEIGYQGLCLLGNFLGYSYQEFRMFYAALFCLFTLIASKRLSPYSNYVLAFFLIWPFFPGVSGLRQTMANMIVCCGIPCLFSEKKSSIIKYILWIALAWTIHQSALFYLVFLFARRSFGDRERRLIFIAVIAGVVLIGFSSFLGSLSFIQDNHKLNKWLSLSADEGADHQNLAGFVIRTFLVGSFAIWIPRLATVIKKHAVLTSDVKRRVEVCSNISLLVLLTIPGYIVSSEYQRFLYGTLMIYYVVYADFRYLHFHRKFPSRLVYIFISLGLVLITAAYYMFSMTSHDVLATLKDNLLF